MDGTLEQIANLERANYAAMLGIAQATPGLDLVLRDDVIITSSTTFPDPDTTHACLLQANPQTADDLINEVIDYFESKGLATTVYLSSACIPTDLGARLSSRGFVRQEADEAWLILENLPSFEIPTAVPHISVRRIAKVETLTFANTFMTAFGIPVDFAPYMAQLLEPCIDLPGVYHYLALSGDQVIGTCSLLCYQNFGILGSVGVVAAHRKNGAATNLAVKAATDARKQGVDTLMLQTTAGTGLERLLRISGFKKAFVRTCYTLS
jgi:hypothetical protein